MHIAASNPLALNSEDIHKDIIENEEKLISQELKNLENQRKLLRKLV